MAATRAEPQDGSALAPRGRPKRQSGLAPRQAPRRTAEDPGTENSPRHDGQAPRQKERYSCGSASGCAGTAEASGPGPAPLR